MLLLPYRIDSLPVERPWANWAFFGLCLAVSGAALDDALPESWIEALVADGWNPVGLFGHVLLHGDYLHLAGNMIFLWVFGNAVCGMVGNVTYLIAFPLCAVLAATIHNLVMSGPLIGASGAINGVIGFVFAICPINRVAMFYWIVVRFGTFRLPAWFIILIWLGFDIFGATHDDGLTAYWAHLGGFASGLSLGMLLLSLKWIVLTEWDNPTLVDILFRRRRAPP